MDFIDLKTQYRAYQTEIDARISRVLSSAAFIQGPEVNELEQALVKFTGAKHAVVCSSGTDALLLPLMALGVGPGDEVIVPDFTFFATAEVVSMLGATPVFADIDAQTWNIDPADVARKITSRTKGIIPVSLYGQCADLDACNALAQKHGLWVLEDAAQSFGATNNGRRSCSMTRIAATSFFPAKPLGAYGDGGALFTNDDLLAAQTRSLLNHGQEGRYNHTRIGINGRLDTLQAAILLVKLAHYPDEMVARDHVANWYTERLQGAVRTPILSPGQTSVWAQYTIAHPERDRIAQHLQSKGIPSSVHYPKPLHLQPVYASLSKPELCPVATDLASKVLSLPMHPFLAEKDVDMICQEIRSIL